MKLIFLLGHLVWL